MTIHDYLIVMNKVRIADLKAHLSEHLRAVKRGNTLTVLDRETPIAQIVPSTSKQGALTIRRPSPSSPGLHQIPLPAPLKVKTDVVVLLLEERQGGR